MLKYTFFTFILTFIFLSSRGQNPVDTITGDPAHILAEKGYENIRVDHRHDTLFIGLENRVWRYEPRAAAEILKLAMPGVAPGGVVVLTLLRSGIPLTTLIVSRHHYDNLLAGRVPAAMFADSVVALLADLDYRASLGKVRPVNPSFNKFDVVIIPQLKAQFGNFVHPLEIQFNVAPAVRIDFFRGLSLTAQMIIPLYNNLIGDEQGNTIRPGLVVLSQAFRLPSQFFATVSAGYFTRDRYGLNGEVRRFFFNGKMGLGATLGYTGQMRLLDSRFTYTSMSVFTWYCDASWRFARYDLTIRAGYGGFIDRDHGWRVDVVRQFGEVSVGFFAMNTGGVMNGGFNFIVPLPPRRYGTKNHIRIRPASYVPWEYRAKGLPSLGRTFTTGNGTEEMMFNMNPDFIRKQLGRQIINNL